MLDIVKGLLSGGPVKLVLILAIISAITGYLVYDDTSSFNAGYNKAKAEYLEAVNEARNEAERASEASLKQLKERLITLEQESYNNKNRAVELQSLLDNRPTVEIIREIETIETGECTDLGSDYKRLLNDIISDPPNISIR